MRSTLTRMLAAVLLIGFALSNLPPLFAQVDRVLPAGEKPQDHRLGELKNLNGYFPFTPPKTKEEWDRRSQRIRRGIKVATGVWPMPTKTPAHAVVHGKIDRGDYTVEKVYFESFPGFYVTGNLYRPKGTSGKCPGVLCPYGHWKNGRFYEHDPKRLAQVLANGGERFERGGRHPIQARCVQLARMGCVVFNYDMVGRPDSNQLGHRDGIRPRMNTLRDWGYFSPQAELRLQSITGLQTYNSIRAFDWFSTLEDVDSTRIGVTGCSGGGTQTFLLCAVDPRPAVAFPAVMVSTAMQGGCPCENASYLRVEEGNIGIAAMMAPRPLGLVGALDWTREIETKGLPELKALYRLLGVEDRVTGRALLHFKHSYNNVMRGMMYNWFNRHLGLGFNEPILEKDYEPLSPEEMTVWDEAHPQPEGGEHFERKLLKWVTEDNQKQLESLLPQKQSDLAEFRKVIGGAVDIMIGRSVPDAAELKLVSAQETTVDGYPLTKGIVRLDVQDESVPIVLLKPQGTKKDQKLARYVVWVDPSGKRAIFDGQGKPISAVRRLLDAGVGVLGLDMIGQGEFTDDGRPVAKARMIKPRRKTVWGAYAGYTYGYNYSLFSQRVHDVLTAIGYLQQTAPSAKIDLVGLDGAGRWAAAARAQAGSLIERAVLDTADFRFASLNEFDHPDFLPGGAKYLDLPGMIALSAPSATWIAGEAQLPAAVKSAFNAAGASDRLTVFRGKKEGQEAAAIKWLLTE